jgi:hypothetical protein
MGYLACFALYHLASLLLYNTYHLMKLATSSQKWAGTCRYTTPKLIFIPEFHTDIYHCILYTFISFYYYDGISFFRFKKYTSISKFSFRALIVTK